MRLIAALLLATAAVPALAEIQPNAAPVDAPTRVFTGSDLFQLSIAADPRISPDGRTIVYVRRSGDVMTDRMQSSLWLIDVATGRQTPFAASGSSPRWSPDGTRIAYVASDGTNPQLFVRWLGSEAATRVTTLPNDPNALAWSPDGHRLAYIATVAGEPTRLGKAPAKPEGAKWAEPLEVIDRVNYRADGGGYIKPGNDHVFVVSADGGGARQLTFGKFDDSGPLSWSPDGRTILFSAIRTPDAERQVMNSDVYAVDAASGELRTLTTRDGPDNAPVFSPDGARIAWLGFDDHHRSYENTQLYVGGRTADAPRSLTASLDRAIEDAAWSADGKSLYASYDDHGKRKLARVTLDGHLTPIADNITGGGIDRPYTGGDFSVSRGGVVAYTGGDASAPADIWAWSGGKARRLTDLNANLLEAKALAPVRKIAVTAPDGRAIDAWLATPPGRQPGQKVPLILEIHGGPNSAYGPGFSTDVQLYAAAGYAVLWTNPRGSTSYGAEFANLIDKNYPSQDYDDLMASVDAAIADGTADPDNLFVTGGSGGGVLTAWIVGKTDRFKAAATQKPVINWTSEALTMDNTVFTSRYWFAKKPWEDPMSYWNRSPLSLVGNVKTPTLVVVGGADYRTPVSESEQYYAALQIRGVPTALVKVPGASHGGLAARPSQSAAKASAIIAWFDRYRAGAAKARAE
ncbi:MULTISPECIES: S9 family peptidase [unclassified Sphingomonas]|uniref:S9 family peptidase n=1 Tax=unclassified Sphingomonas TaxID=196159 RepID=UPI000929AAF1|nr:MULTISPECIES: S9 family peptidase [unclassified Sphingomonas]MBN8847994.1 S9 family peptidase [Sphingomonas sp.]OJV34260.1 MAG: peptidase S9 family protein [Sphingomonas sp. 67-36]